MLNTIDILNVMYDIFPLPSYKHINNSYTCFTVRCHCHNIAYDMIMRGEY